MTEKAIEVIVVRESMLTAICTTFVHCYAKPSLAFIIYFGCITFVKCIYLYNYVSSIAFKFNINFYVCCTIVYEFVINNNINNNT